MKQRRKSRGSEIQVPCDLGVEGAPEIHRDLLEKSSEGPGEVGVRIDLSGDGPVWPLALQLLVSAAHSFPPDKVTFGPAATAALRTVEITMGETS